MIARLPMRPMPGWKLFCRTWDGWASIQPTTCWPIPDIFEPPLDAITRMYRLRAASTGVEAQASFTSLLRFQNMLKCRPSTRICRCRRTGPSWWSGRRNLQRRPPLCSNSSKCNNSKAGGLVSKKIEGLRVQKNATFGLWSFIETTNQSKIKVLGRVGRSLDHPRNPGYGVICAPEWGILCGSTGNPAPKGTRCTYPLLLGRR